MVDVKIYSDEQRVWTAVNRDILEKEIDLSLIKDSRQKNNMVYLSEKDAKLIIKNVVYRKDYGKRCPIISYDKFTPDNPEVRYRVFLSQKFGRYTVEWTSNLYDTYDEAVDLFNEVCKSPHFFDGRIEEKKGNKFVR